MTEQAISAEQVRVLLSETAKSMEYSSRVLEGLVAFRRQCVAQGVAFPSATHNAFEFVLHLHFDISCLTSDMLGRPADLRAGLYARLIVLTIYEATLTLKSLLAKPFQDEVRDLCGEPQVFQVRDAHKRLQEVFELARTRFGDVRHGLAAHRDADPELRLALMEKATPRSVNDLVIAFLAANMGLLQHFAFYSKRFRGADA